MSLDNRAYNMLSSTGHLAVVTLGINSARVEVTFLIPASASKREIALAACCYRC